jgi:hypothetical protein
LLELAVGRRERFFVDHRTGPDLHHRTEDIVVRVPRPKLTGVISRSPSAVLPCYDGSSGSRMIQSDVDIKRYIERGKIRIEDSRDPFIDLPIGQDSRRLHPSSPSFMPQYAKPGSKYAGQAAPLAGRLSSEVTASKYR